MCCRYLWSYSNQVTARQVKTVIVDMVLMCVQVHVTVGLLEVPVGADVMEGGGLGGGVSEAGRGDGESSTAERETGVTSQDGVCLCVSMCVSHLARSSCQSPSRLPPRCRPPVAMAPAPPPHTP